MSSTCLLTTGHRPFDRRVFHKEARSLVDYGYDVTIVAHAEADTTRHGVDVVSLGTKSSRSDRVRHLKRAYRTATRVDADIYHFHDPELLPVGLWLSRNTDASVIFDAHEDYGQNAVYRRPWIPGFGTEFVRRVYPATQAFFARRLDAVVTTTELIADEFRRRDYPEVTLVRNFPVTERIEVADRSAERDHEYLLAYVGGLEEERGLTTMLETLARLRDSGLDVGLWLLGPFRTDVERNERTVERYRRERDLDDHVRLFGYVPHEDIFGYLQAADVGLALVDERQFEYILPTKIFEYMYTELPVVVTDTGPARNYVSEEYGALVDGEPGEIAETIREWFADGDVDEMGAAGREEVLAEYNWEREAQTLAGLYADLL